MRYVLDSSVALKWVLPEADSGIARRILNALNAGLHELFVPDFFLLEVANGLFGAELQRRIGAGEAAIFLQDIAQQPLVALPYGPFLPRALDIALGTRTAVYDCVYVALAEHLGCECVTADDVLLRRLRPHFPFLLRLSDFP